MNYESYDIYGIKNVKRYLILQYTRKSIYLCILTQISLMKSRYFSESSLVPLSPSLEISESPSSLEQLQPQVVAKRLYLRGTCGTSFNLSHFQHVEIIAFQNCLQERRAQACFGKLTIVHSQILLFIDISNFKYWFKFERLHTLTSFIFMMCLICSRVPL